MKEELVRFLKSMDMSHIFLFFCT